MDLKWLRGRTCARVFEHYPQNTTFEFGDAQLAADCWWRIIARGQVALTSADNGHQYGLPQPVQARREAVSILAKRKVVDALVVGTADVVITFEDDVRLEVLVGSSGYESWNLTAPGVNIVAMPGGQVSDFSPEA